MYDEAVLRRHLLRGLREARTETLVVLYACTSSWVVGSLAKFLWSEIKYALEKRLVITV